ncbi:hypothetical protein ADA01nite_32700 [Aneurinibacillus danicus]|uniref:Transposase IS701-like DDE domain-containing protein n=1 Tax=Aneurinibacillus danicus TaxID=267746 RepID=A0A511VA59_9BACL|nr:hypothetical protein ADA01nite_32700 [Aneurinibacillus danicus]
MIEQNNQLPNELHTVFKELEILKHLRNANIKKSDTLPAKDAVSRFLNHSKFAWRRFLLTFSASAIQKVSTLTDAKRVRVFIVDDSMFDRNRSKKVELLARCIDHSSLKKRFYKGFRMLTLGWSDGHSFMPIDFSLLKFHKRPNQWDFRRD